MKQTSLEGSEPLCAIALVYETAYDDIGRKFCIVFIEVGCLASLGVISYDTTVVGAEPEYAVWCFCHGIDVAHRNIYEACLTQHAEVDTILICAYPHASVVGLVHGVQSNIRYGSLVFFVVGIVYQFLFLYI